VHADAETQLNSMSNMVADSDIVGLLRRDHIAAATIRDPSNLKSLVFLSYHYLHLSGGPIVVSRSLPLFATDWQFDPVACH